MATCGGAWRPASHGCAGCRRIKMRPEAGSKRPTLRPRRLASRKRRAASLLNLRVVHDIIARVETTALAAVCGQTHRRTGLRRKYTRTRLFVRLLDGGLTPGASTWRCTNSTPFAATCRRPAPSGGCGRVAVAGLRPRADRRPGGCLARPPRASLRRPMSPGGARRPELPPVWAVPGQWTLRLLRPASVGCGWSRPSGRRRRAAPPSGGGPADPPSRTAVRSAWGGIT